MNKFFMIIDTILTLIILSIIHTPFIIIFLASIDANKIIFGILIIIMTLISIISITINHIYDLWINK